MARRDDGIGFWLTSAIVVGTVIGSGIFLLPASLAPLGANAPIAWVVSGVGAMCIAFALSRIVRPEGGGLQSYVEAELGPTAGFIVTFALWTASCTGIAGPSIAAAAAFSILVPALSDPWSVAMVALVTTIALTIINARGIRAAGSLALVTIAIRIVPLLAVIVVALMRGANHQRLTPLAPTPITLDNIAAAVTLTLFAIIGFEVGTTPVGKVRNPSRTIPLALMAGTAFCVVLYLLSSTSVTLILSPQATATSLAPYADALKGNFGEAAVGLAAIAIIVAAVGGANTSILVAGELGYSMALRRDLPQICRADQPDEHARGQSGSGKHLRDRADLVQREQKHGSDVHFLEPSGNDGDARGLRAGRVYRFAAPTIGNRDSGHRYQHPFFVVRLLRRRPEREPARPGFFGRRPWNPLAMPPAYALARRLQPSGGGESSRASGIIRLSFFEKLRRHTSLVPSGPAL